MFYKLDNGSLVVGSHVDGPEFSLSPESKGAYTYPVQGWYWLESGAPEDVDLYPVTDETVGLKEALREAQTALTASDASDALYMPDINGGRIL